MGSDRWFREFERQISNGENAGLSFDAAYKRATERTDDALREKMADAADRARKIQKGE